MSAQLPLDRFQRLQQAIAGYLSATPFFNGVSIFISTPIITPDGTLVTSPDLQSQIQNVLTGIQGRNGFLGVACVVLLPSMSIFDHRSVVAQEEIEITIRWIENVLFNFGTNGTGITAMSFCDMGVNKLQGWSPGSEWGKYNLKGREGRTMQPVALQGDDGTYRIYESTFFVEAAGLATLRVAPVVVSVNAGNVTLSCATPGASIYYTTDGTFPWSGNSRATLYTGTFTYNQGAFIQAEAFASSLDGSHLIQYKLAPTTVLTDDAGTNLLTDDSGSNFLVPQ